MLLLSAVQMHGPGEIGTRLEQVHLLLEQQRVRADDHEFLARDDAFDDLIEFLVQQRLAAGQHDHRRAALVHRLQTLGDRESLVQDLGRIINFSATGAGEIATKQGLQHKHERVAFPSHQMLLDDIGANAHCLVQRNCHFANPYASPT